MRPRNSLHRITCVLLPLTIAAAIWAGRVERGYSHALRQRAQLGLPGFFVSVPVAIELAGSPANFRKVFGVAVVTGNAGIGDVSAADRNQVRQGLRRGYFLILGYTSLMIALGLRTWQPGDTHPRWMRWALVILPLIVGGSDVLENIGASRALDEFANIQPALTQMTAAASRIKWLSGFAEMILLGCSLLGTSPLRDDFGAFLRELAALMLLSAGVIGLTGMIAPSIIPNTFAFGLLAMLPIGLMLFFRDEGWRCDCRLRQLRW